MVGSRASIPVPLARRGGRKLCPGHLGIWRPGCDGGMMIMLAVLDAGLSLVPWFGSSASVLRRVPREWIVAVSTCIRVLI